MNDENYRQFGLFLDINKRKFVEKKPKES
jgi:hypothetical protein